MSWTIFSPRRGRTHADPVYIIAMTASSMPTPRLTSPAGTALPDAPGGVGASRAGLRDLKAGDTLTVYDQLEIGEGTVTRLEQECIWVRLQHSGVEVPATHGDRNRLGHRTATPGPTS